MLTVNKSSHELRTYEASLVKFDDPGCIILDIHYRDRNMIAEAEKIKAINRRITSHWNIHEDAPIDGRRYLLGEIVAVNLVTSWKAAMIVNFKFVEGLHHYELVLLDTGHLVEVHRMAFRQLNDDFKIIPRYSFFIIMNLIPAGDDVSSMTSWNIDSCDDLRLMFDLASSITVTVMAKQKFCNSERLFGNIYIHIGKHTIDVKEMLLKNNAAYEDLDIFKCIYQLSERDFCDQSSEETSDAELLEEPEYEEVDVNEITDETLDDHLIKEWRRGGGDPLTQQERLRVRDKLMSEARISFTPRVRATESAVKKLHSQGSEYSDSTMFEQENSTLRGEINSLQGLENKKPVTLEGNKQTKGKKYLYSQIEFSNHKSVEDITNLDSEDTMNESWEDEEYEKLNKSEPSLVPEDSGSVATTSSLNNISGDHGQYKETSKFWEKMRERRLHVSEKSDQSVEILSEEDEKKLCALFK